MALDPGATFTWYGHSCWQLETPGGKVVLFDPWFKNPRSPKAPACGNCGAPNGQA